MFGIMKKCLAIFCCALALSGCGVVDTTAHKLDDYPKSPDIQIVLDDQQIKFSDYGPAFVEKLKNAFSHSFDRVMVATGQSKANPDEILVIPKTIMSSAYKSGEQYYGNADAIVSLLTADSDNVYTFKSNSCMEKEKIPLWAKVALLPVGVAGVILEHTTSTRDGKPLFDKEKSQANVDSIHESSAKQQALENLAIDIHNAVVLSRELRSIIEQRALPSDLTITAKFSDTSGFNPNNTLDAGEEAELLVTIKNTGKGAGYGTELELSADNPKIALDQKLTIGDVQQGEEKEIKVKLKAGLDLALGKTPFTLRLKEKRGYDAKKVVINVPTAKLEPPQLEIVSTEINDGDTGLAKGNGNGIPESGETVELLAFIRNNGAGKAVGVNLTGSELTPGVQWVRGSTLVGTIQPGETVKAKLAFVVPRNFDAKEITSNLKASDLRGVGYGERKVAYAFGRLAPDLHYAWRLFSKGEEVKSITNGGEYEVELTLNNKGQIAARDVTLTLAAAGATLSRSRIEAGEIKPLAGVPSHRISLSLPRTFGKGDVIIPVEIAQTDFPETRNSIRIPVELKSPKLRYIPTLHGKGGGNAMQQGEQAVLEIQVLNEGSLPAEGVKVKLASKDPYLTIQGKAEESVGTIRPSAGETLKFLISTSRRIQAGDAFLTIDISQNDFTPVNALYALNIQEEGANVIEVAADEMMKPTVALSAAVMSGPAITLKSRIAETSDESIRLAFDVADAEKNIDSASIKVMVNGMSISLDEDAGVTAKPEKSKQIITTLPLREGENRIVITARNTDYAQARKEFIIARSGEDDVDTPPLTGAQNTDAVAMVIGVSRYKNKEMPPVDYARRDAETVRNYLVKTLGYDENRIIEAYDEDADRTSLVAGLFDDLRNRVVPGRSDVFIYYSGHGMPDVDSKGAAKDAYLAPYDFRSTSTQRTGIALKELYEQLETLDARSVTVVMDACFSGTTERGSLVKGISAVLEVSNPMLRLKNGTIFTASSSKEAARWYDKKRHGLFTYYFLQGIRGKADSDRNGLVTKKELEEFVRRNVAEQSQYRQNPTAMGNPDMVLVRLK